MRTSDLKFIQQWTLVVSDARYRTRGIGPKIVVPFREIAADSGGSTFCDTQHNCRTSFTITTALLSPPFFGH